MDGVRHAIRDLAVANRILAHHGVFDDYGHVSVRHPVDRNRFLLACDRAAALVEPDDIMTLGPDGDVPAEDNRPPCPERVLHAAVYAARPDVTAVLCAGAEDVLPFSLVPVPLRPVLGAVGDMGQEIPVWDIADAFGSATDLSVSTPARGRDLAQRLGRNRMVLMRGIGFVATGRTLNDAVRMSVYVPKNARALAASLQVGTGIRPISPGETAARLAIDPESNAMRRGWEYWARQAGCERWL